MFRRLMRLAVWLVCWAPSTSLAQPVPGVLGAACAVDGDCDQGLRCITVDSHELSGRGAAGGICTRDCASDNDCAAWPPRGTNFVSTCESFGGRKLCFEPCQVGSPYDFNCHLREDLACRSFGKVFSETTQLGSCVPLCTSDGQCAGRHCNPALGLCQDDPVVGDPVGASCDPQASEPTCAGFCDTSQAGDGDVGSAPGTCSALCVVNGPFGCGWASEGTPDAFCSWGGRLKPGDQSLCVQLCDCDADCRNPRLVCGLGASAYGRAGRCVNLASGVVSAPRCVKTPELGHCFNGPDQACKGASGCLGRARCLADASGYAACQCADANAAAAGAGITTDEGGAGNQAGQPSGGEAFGHPPSEGGAAVAPNRSGKTPALGCSCSLRPRRNGLGWLAATSLLAWFARRRRARWSSPR